MTKSTSCVLIKDVAEAALEEHLDRVMEEVAGDRMYPHEKRPSRCEVVRDACVDVPVR